MAGVALGREGRGTGTRDRELLIDLGVFETEEVEDAVEADC